MEPSLCWQVRADFLDEVLRVAEVAVNASKTNRSDLINIGQMPHDDFADLMAVDLHFELLTNFQFDGKYHCLDSFGGYRAFPASTFDAAAEFISVERFSAIIAFDDPDGSALDSFQSGEPAVAGGTTSSSANDVAIV